MTLCVPKFLSAFLSEFWPVSNTCASFGSCIPIERFQTAAAAPAIDRLRALRTAIGEMRIGPEGRSIGSG